MRIIRREIILEGSPEELRELPELFGAFHLSSEPAQSPPLAQTPEEPASSHRSKSPRKAEPVNNRAKPRRRSPRASPAAEKAMDELVVETIAGGGKRSNLRWDEADLSDEMVEEIVSSLRRSRHGGSAHALRFLRMVYEAGEEGVSGKELPEKFGVSPMTFRSIVGNLGMVIRKRCDIATIERPTELLIERVRRGKGITYRATPKFLDAVNRQGLFLNNDSNGFSP